jgi:hypothetical protein
MNADQRKLIFISGQVNGKYQSTEQRRTQKGQTHGAQEAGAQETTGLSTRQQEAKSEEVGERSGEAVVLRNGLEFSRELPETASQGTLCRGPSTRAHSRQRRALALAQDDKGWGVVVS